MDKICQLGCRIAQNHAAAEINQRAFGRSKHLHRFFNLADVPLHYRLVRADKQIFLRIAELGNRLGYVFGDVHHHRAGAAAAGDLESLFNRRRQIVDIRYQEIVFYTWAGNSHHINLLESIAADHRRADLAGNHHQRHRIGVGGGDAGNRIGGARAGRYQRHADLAASARISIRRVYRRLLVSGQNVFEFMQLVDGVVDFENRAAGITENVLDALGLKALHNDLCT